MENIFDRRSRGGGGEEGKRTRQTRAPILAKVKRAHTDRQEKRRRWGEGGKWGGRRWKSYTKKGKQKGKQGRRGVDRKRMSPGQGVHGQGRGSKMEQAGEAHCPHCPVFACLSMKTAPRWLGKRDAVTVMNSVPFHPMKLHFPHPLLLPLLITKLTARLSFTKCHKTRVAATTECCNNDSSWIESLGSGTGKFSLRFPSFRA